MILYILTCSPIKYGFLMFNVHLFFRCLVSGTHFTLFYFYFSHSLQRKHFFLFFFFSTQYLFHPFLSAIYLSFNFVQGEWKKTFFPRFFSFVCLLFLCIRIHLEYFFLFFVFFMPFGVCVFIQKVCLQQGTNLNIAHAFDA